MKNTSTYLVVCPHCGEVKRVAFSTVRWNDVTYVFWSDGRIESEEWCEPAYIQQCPVCKYFFPLPPRNSLPVEKAPCDDTGFLPYQTLKQAVEELAGNEKTEVNARLEAWWAYNKHYRDVDEENIPIEERKYNRSNMQWLLDYYSKETPSPYSFIFELHRQLGNLNEYRRLLDELTYERYLEWRKERAKKHGRNLQLEEDTIKSLYYRMIKEKKEALEKPLKSYQL